LAEPSQPIARTLAEGGIARQVSGGALVQAKAAQRWGVDSPRCVIPGCPAATLDRDLSLGAKAIEDAPERRLADSRPYQANEIRSPEARRFQHQKLQHLLARPRSHASSPISVNRIRIDTTRLWASKRAQGPKPRKLLWRNFEAGATPSD
jgi:hypothetical protein